MLIQWWSWSRGERFNRELSLTGTSCLRCILCCWWTWLMSGSRDNMGLDELLLLLDLIDRERLTESALAGWIHCCCWTWWMWALGRWGHPIWSIHYCFLHLCLSGLIHYCFLHLCLSGLILMIPCSEIMAPCGGGVCSPSTMFKICKWLLLPYLL